LKREYGLYLQDIIDAIEKIEEFVDSIDYNGFLNDDKTRSAVVRKLEIIGEARRTFLIPSGLSIRTFHGEKWLK